MKILISGASGLIGKHLQKEFESAGHQVFRLGRNKPQGSFDIQWDIDNNFIEKDKIEGIDIVIHLAGESISGGRWTSEKKKKIRESRIKGTELISQTIASLAVKPKLLISASAIGYYGDRADEELRENSSTGNNFLAEVCNEWEKATKTASDNGIRVVNLRFGIVLAKDGGALAQMLFPFKMGLGGKLGSGKQYMSWIALEETAPLIKHIIDTPSINGPVNAVSPRPVRNTEFTGILAKSLSRPALFPVPFFAAHLLFGQMADELLFASARVIPQKLINTAYHFKYPNLEQALYSILYKNQSVQNKKVLERV